VLIKQLLSRFKIPGFKVKLMKRSVRFDDECGVHPVLAIR